MSPLEALLTSFMTQLARHVPTLQNYVIRLFDKKLISKITHWYKGRYGFLLPPEQIKPVAEEMWAGFTKMADHVIAGKCDSK